MKFSDSKSCCLIVAGDTVGREISPTIPFLRSLSECSGVPIDWIHPGFFKLETSTVSLEDLQFFGLAISVVVSGKLSVVSCKTVKH